MPKKMEPEGRYRPWLVRRFQSALGGGLAVAYKRAQLDPEKFLAELQRRHRLPIRSFREMQALPLETVESLADSTIRHSLRMAALEGAGFGLFGLLSIVPDTAILATISVQMIQRLSLIYGFEISTLEERAQLWSAAATAVGVDMGKDWLERQVLERFVPRVIVRISERMGVEMAERAAAKAIPFLSSALGAGLNYWFVRSWGRRVRLHFRARHLEQRGLLELPAPAV